jgi:divalent metal cation (Fe/Co/Zn/Cd) transporter
MKNAGIGLLAIGIVITIVTSVSFFTKEKVVDIGSLEITRDKKHNMAWSPFLGIGVMLVGGGLLVYSGKK